MKKNTRSLGLLSIIAALFIVIMTQSAIASDLAEGPVVRRKPADSAAKHDAMRISGATQINIDGRLDESVWLTAPVHDEFVQLLPRDRQPARWRTTVQILVNDDSLIFGIRAFDPDVKAIRAPILRRDHVSRNQDFVSVYIDPMGRRTNAQFFRVSASGIIADGTYSAQDATDNLAPDFDVQAAAHRLPDGYSVELRIPFAELRYPLEGGLPWRFMVARNVPRADNAFWVNVPLTSDALNILAELRPIDGIEDVLEGVRDRGFIRIRPEVTFRRTTARHPDGERSGGGDLSLGLTMKWRPRADWVIDGLLNPDYSQVELDQPQLSRNVRYALFQTEKRPFFLESIDVTGQGRGDDDGAARGLAGFYSRAFANPRFGARATWRGVGSEATALVLRDKGGGTMLRPNAYGTREAVIEQSSDAGFTRARWQLQRMGVAALLSTRNYGGGRYNNVAGASLESSAAESLRWRAQGLFSSTTASLSDDEHLERTNAQRGHYVWLDSQYRSEDWASQLHFEEISPRFVNDNGFVNQSGIRRVSYEASRRLGSMPMGLFEADEFELQLSVQETRGMADQQYGVRSGELVGRTVSPGLWFSGPRMLDAWLHFNTRQVRSETGGSLHDERTVNVGFTINPSAWFSSLSLEWEGGRLLDADANRIADGRVGRAEMQFRLAAPGGKTMEISPVLRWTSLDRPDGGRSLTEWAGRILTVLQLSAEDSLRLIIQRQRTVRSAEIPLFQYESGGSDVRSFVYHRRDTRGAVLAAGVTDTRALQGQNRQTEWFIKYSVDYWH